MNDQPDQPDPSNPPTQPLQPEPEHRVLPPDPTLQHEAGAAPPPKQRFVDRLWSLRAVIAVALASVILGGLGGAALASAAGDDGDVRRGPGPGFRHGGPMNPPPGMQHWRGGQDQQRQWQQRPRQRGGQDNRGPGMVPQRPGTPTPSPAKPTPSS